MSTPCQVASLQDICRRSILARLTIKHVQQVKSLPTPNVVKDFLTSFSVCADFDLSGMYVDYNFNFPHHVHHHSHQVHPGICKHDQSKVLLKCFSDKPCSMCGIEACDFHHGRKLQQKWKSLHHKYLQKCLLSDVENIHNFTIYVIEFPLMTIVDYAYKVYMAGNTVPECKLWEILYKLSSVFLYLEKENVQAWELCRPEHVVINEHGEIKLENLLLYLPGKGAFNPRRNATRSLLGARLPIHNETIVCKIADIVYRLTSFIPPVLINNEKAVNNLGYLFSGRAYSRRLYHVLECSSADLQLQPSLRKVNSIAKRNLQNTKTNRDTSRNLLYYTIKHD